MDDPDLNGPAVIKHAGALCNLALQDPHFGATLLRASLMLRANLAVNQPDPAAALEELLDEDRDNLRSCYAAIVEEGCHGHA